MFELLDRQSAVCDGSLQLSSLKGEVKFNNVTFSYPSRPDTVVLKVFNMYKVCESFQKYHL